jgi:hypothetical protein
MRPLTYPYSLLLSTGLLFLIFSLFARGNTIDIHLHDLVIIISYKHVFWGCTFLLGLFWIVYRLTYKLLPWRFLTIVHILVTSGALILFFLVPYILEIFRGAGILGVSNYESKQIMNYSLTIVSILLVVGQLLFLINLIVGLIKKLI